MNFISGFDSLHSDTPNWSSTVARSKVTTLCLLINYSSLLYPR